MEEKNNHLKEALSFQSHYCYENSDVYLNALNVKDRTQLEYLENMLSTLQISKLNKKGYKCKNSEKQLFSESTSNKFDINHLISIHKFLFKEIYPLFAGVFRDENIVKGNTPFCRPEFIKIYLEQTLTNLKKDILKVQNRDEFIKVISYYYGEINIIHPFREGNGRTQREFFRQFVECYSQKLCLGNYNLDYSIIKENPNLRDEFIKASIASVKGNYQLFENIFNELIMDENKKNSK